MKHYITLLLDWGLIMASDNYLYEHHITFYLTGFGLAQLLAKVQKFQAEHPDDFIDGVYVHQIIHLPHDLLDEYEEDCEIVFYPASVEQSQCDIYNDMEIFDK